MRVAEWVTRRHRPDGIISDPEFREIIVYLNPNAELMSDNTLRRDVSECVRLKEEAVMALLQEYAGRVNIILDGWTSPNHIEFLGVIGNFIHKGISYNIVLDMIELTERHTGDYLATVVFSLLQRYKIEKRTLGFVADNASNNDKMLKSLDQLIDPDDIAGTQTQVRCFGHILNLIYKAVCSVFYKEKKKKKKGKGKGKGKGRKGKGKGKEKADTPEPELVEKEFEGEEEEDDDEEEEEKEDDDDPLRDDEDDELDEDDIAEMTERQKRREEDEDALLEELGTGLRSLTDLTPEEKKEAITAMTKVCHSPILFFSTQRLTNLSDRENRSPLHPQKGVPNITRTVLRRRQLAGPQDDQAGRHAMEYDARRCETRSQNA